MFGAHVRFNEIIQQHNKASNVITFIKVKDNFKELYHTVVKKKDLKLNIKSFGETAWEEEDDMSFYLLKYRPLSTK